MALSILGSLFLYFVGMVITSVLYQWITKTKGPNYATLVVMWPGTWVVSAFVGLVFIMLMGATYLARPFARTAS